MVQYRFPFEERQRRFDWAKTNPHGVKIGQIWEDLDKRATIKQVTVMEISGAYAVCRRGASDVGKSTRIRLDRFTKSSTGFRLVQDVIAS
jgi:hypothetical protein